MLSLKKNIRQSIVGWCYQAGGDMWSMDRLCEVTRELGCDAVEIVPFEDWDTLKKHGIGCALAPNGMPGAPFVKGLNNKAYHGEVLECMTKAIEKTAAAGFPNVTQYPRWYPPDEGTPWIPR